MRRLEQLITWNYFKLIAIAGISISSGCRDNSNYHNFEDHNSGYYDSYNESSSGIDVFTPDLVVDKKPDYSSPQNTYNSLISALKKNDLEASLQCFDSSSADREKLKNFDLIRLGNQIDNIIFDNEYLIAPGVTQIEYTAEDGRKLPMLLYQELNNTNTNKTNTDTNIYEWKIHVLL